MEYFHCKSFAFLQSNRSVGNRILKEICKGFLWIYNGFATKQSIVDMWFFCSMLLWLFDINISLLIMFYSCYNVMGVCLKLINSLNENAIFLLIFDPNQMCNYSLFNNWSKFNWIYGYLSCFIHVIIFFQDYIVKLLGQVERLNSSIGSLVV